MPTRTAAYFARHKRTVLIALAGGAVVGALPLPYWQRAVVAAVVGGVVGLAARPARHAWLLWTTRKARRAPLIYNDDGIVIPVMLPGEHFTVAMAECANGHTHVVARVLRPDGSIRKTGSWQR